MKKIMAYLAVMVFALGLGTAYAGMGHEGLLITFLDPSKVAGYLDPESGAVVAGRADGIARGSAAGGPGMEHETLLTFIDPSKVAGYVDPESGSVATGAGTFIDRGSAAGGVRMDPDTLLNYIDPSSLHGFKDPERGGITW